MKKSVLITGGCGFIGTNIAARHIQAGDDVAVADSLVRPGTVFNLEYLRSLGEVFYVPLDLRNRSDVFDLIRDHHFDAVYHMAAQVAVTTSIVRPEVDFDTNALGTFNLLEALRRFEPETRLVYASTNKVYGEMPGVPIVLNHKTNRYEYADRQGIDEGQPLSFATPYGCSKGAADQYVLEYARQYAMNTVVFRQSCIYGPRQFGLEDQGWVAWLTIRAIARKPITIYGDGRQVRDVLYVDDLVDAYDLALDHIGTTRGKAYNIGGGPGNTLSLLELLDILKADEPEVKYAIWRSGDQRVFICDVSRAKKDFGWEPRTSPERGTTKLYNWCTANMDTLRRAGIV